MEWTLKPFILLQWSVHLLWKRLRLRPKLAWFISRVSTSGSVSLGALEQWYIKVNFVTSCTSRDLMVSFWSALTLISKLQAAYIIIPFQSIYLISMVCSSVCQSDIFYPERSIHCLFCLPVNICHQGRHTDFFFTISSALSDCCINSTL